MRAAGAGPRSDLGFTPERGPIHPIHTGGTAVPDHPAQTDAPGTMTTQPDDPAPADVATDPSGLRDGDSTSTD